MRASNLLYAAIGYTLGARAGRERYEELVRVARRVVGSQTVQSTAGVAQARLDHLIRQARTATAGRMNGEQHHR